MEKLECILKTILQEQRLAVGARELDKLSENVRAIRVELRAARDKAREDMYYRMNSIETMGAQLEGNEVVRVDYHGLHVSEMRLKIQRTRLANSARDQEDDDHHRPRLAQPRQGKQTEEGTTQVDWTIRNNSLLAARQAERRCNLCGMDGVNEQIRFVLSIERWQ